MSAAANAVSRVSPDGRRLVTVTDISRRLGFQLTTAFVQDTLKVESVSQTRMAFLWHEDDFYEKIIPAMINYLEQGVK